MLKTFDEVSKIISDGGLLHVAGAEKLLKKLPKGNWIGGSTEYFMTAEGGVITDEKLFVTSFPYKNFKIASYDAGNIAKVAADAFDNGFALVIIPFDSAVHKEYAENAANFQEMFIKNVAGWISGFNLSKEGQTPICVNGKTGEVFADKAAVLHLDVPAEKTVSINIVNIFEQDASSPSITFEEEGFAVTKCFIDGREVIFSDYIAEKGIDTKLPLVGDYSGNGVNISFKAIENGVVSFYAPVFNGIKYKMARSIGDYENEFQKHLVGVSDTSAAFSNNCVLNFLYGGLEGKCIEAFAGPITFGEIAYQLVNQTLVYVTVS